MASKRIELQSPYPAGETVTPLLICVCGPQEILKIKTFLGASRNAVLTQIRIALCVYFLLAYLKFVSANSQSLQSMIRLLQLN